MKTLFSVLFTVGVMTLGCSADTRNPEVLALIQDVSELPAELEAMAVGPNEDSPYAQRLRRRESLYLQLHQRGENAVTALATGLSDADVSIRRASALALGALGRGYFVSGRQLAELDILSALAALEDALLDTDDRVRHLATNAIAVMGPEAASAVPQLIIQLQSGDEGDRNTAAIALRQIGRAASAALPALEVALSDPSDDVRTFARLAIDGIDSSETEQSGSQTDGGF